MVAVTIRDLVVRYGDGPGATAVVDGVNLRVEPQELFLLLGPSGSGKTTVLRSVAGFVQPNAGSIHFDDQDVTRLPAHARNAGMVFQSFALWPHMTVAQNVGFGLREQRIPRRELTDRVEAALESTQMQGFGARRVDELSGGEQQRVALARALVVRPRCLLLDEPLASLDARLRRSMREEIRRICKSFGLTTIYVTHDQKEALAVADRVGVMQGGKLLQVGTPGDIYRRPRSRAVADFVGDTNLFEGRVVLPDAGGAGLVKLETPLGPLVAATPAPWPAASAPAGVAAAMGQRFWISIRPECLRLTTPGAAAAGSAPVVNRFRARMAGTVYLGELAEQRVQVNDHQLSLFQLNPSASGSALASSVDGGELEVVVDPADVVLLPFDPDHEHEDDDERRGAASRPVAGQPLRGKE
ncbi:MAG: ABC transporter ATP-binding protein [Myxococcales bacterium]